MGVLRLRGFYFTKEIVAMNIKVAGRGTGGLDWMGMKDGILDAYIPRIVLDVSRI